MPFHERFPPELQKKKRDLIRCDHYGPNDGYRLICEMLWQVHLMWFGPSFKSGIFLYENASAIIIFYTFCPQRNHVIFLGG